MTGGNQTKRRGRRWLLMGLVVAAPALAGIGAVSGTAAAKPGPSEAEIAKQPPASVWAFSQPGVQHLKYKYGPVAIEPGQNNITFSQGQVPKPTEDGYIVSIKPNITTPDGKVPPVDVIHLHHGVWINRSAVRDPSRGSSTFFAAGEEKTTMRLPKGYGYPYKASDTWIINYMIHDLTPGPFKVFITYDVDFVPATSPSAAAIAPARPIWMDVHPGLYPVFDVIKGSGANGTFTYPDQADNPYGTGRPQNEWTVDHDSILLGTAGHLHPGGLHDDLWLDRAGATGTPSSSAVRDKPGTAHLFKSVAEYFEPAGAVSWDVTMTATPPDWGVQVRKGDVLRINTTYDSKRASWYESMGIMVVWMTDGTTGKDPFTTKVDLAGSPTHGHLPENNHHGGKVVTLKDATKFAPAPTTGPITIDTFIYSVGDMTGKKVIPEVKAGSSITFVNNDAPLGNGIWHSITACRAPCNKETGVAYPLADADVQFDSGQLGKAGPPTAGTISWDTPASLQPGTYTYFCRIHPFMRGAFKVDKAS